jgi:hypothetical protein
MGTEAGYPSGGMAAVNPGAVAQLIDAAQRGSIQDIQECVDIPDVNQAMALMNGGDENGFTALHHCAQLGQAAAGSILVECGADTNVLDKDNNSPLHITAIHNKRLVASMLLWGGAKRDLVNDKGNTALHEAVIANAPHVIYLIVENGGEQTKDVKNKEGKTPVELAEGNQTLLDALNGEV